MAPVRILVADDDPWILKMVTSVLEGSGYVVETASDGEEALARALAAPPRLLITDAMMPKMDGWTLVKTLRARPELAFLPVIFLTSLGSDDDRLRGFRLGADDYISKPFRFEELALRVKKTLRRGRTLEVNARSLLGLPTGAETPPEPGPATPAAPAVAPPGEGELHIVGVGFLGQLEQVALSALLTILEMERKTGVLVVVRAGDGLAARVWLRDGSAIAARIDGQATPVHQECVFAMLGWGAGSFEFNQARVDEPDQIRRSTTHLLMEGARRIDEATREPGSD